MLLQVVKGPSTSISLRTFQGITFDIIQETSKAMSRLQDDIY